MSESHRLPPPFFTRRTCGIVTVHGEIDIVTGDLFTAAVSAVVEDADAREPPGGACLDLAGVEFIDVAGARVLVAATTRLRGLELIVYHPPVMLVRIIELGWGKVPGLRFEQIRNMHTLPAIMA